MGTSSTRVDVRNCLLQMRRIFCKIVTSVIKPVGMMMTTRWKLWIGASALAMASGALPAAQILSPISMSVFGVDLTNGASAQESESGEGEDGGATECTSESGEGEEGGETECAPSGEEGEGEG